VPVVSGVVVVVVPVVVVPEVPPVSEGVITVVLPLGAGVAAGVSTLMLLPPAGVVVRGAPKKYHKAIPARIIMTIIATIPTLLSSRSAMTFLLFPYFNNLIIASKF
jgi:hypothetical protein